VPLSSSYEGFKDKPLPQQQNTSQAERWYSRELHIFSYLFVITVSITAKK